MRLLSLDRIPNLFSAQDSETADTLRAREELCASIPDGQEIWFLSVRTPCRPSLSAQRTARPPGPSPPTTWPATTQSRRACAVRLHTMTAATLELAAHGELGASWARHYALVVWPPTAETNRERLADAWVQKEDHARKLDFRRHYEAAIESNDFLGYVHAALSDMEILTRRVEGPEALTLIWERLHPAAGRTRSTAPRRTLRANHRADTPGGRSRPSPDRRRTLRRAARPRDPGRRNRRQRPAVAAPR